MRTMGRAASARIARARVAGALVLAVLGSPALASETCSWSHTPSGADNGTCIDSTGRDYCVSCQYAPRVCVRRPC